MKCRACQSDTDVFVDLGQAPLSNDLRDNPDQPQNWYPLRLYRCDNCDLVQTAADIPATEIFTDDYPYFSSANGTDYWEKYADWVTHYHVCDMGRPDGDKRILEIASNDGYLLQHFDCDVVGYEPCGSVADAAEAKGIKTVREFFDENTKDSADIIIGNNVLAHTPDPVGMLRGVKNVLNPDGAAIFEFPHIANMVEKMEWDTIYHEHYSYLSVTAVKNMAKMVGLRFVYAMDTPMHGGSVRVLLKHGDESIPFIDKSYDLEFMDKIKEHKRDILKAVIQLKDDGLSIAGFGAAAKAATLINYCGIGDMIDFIADNTEAKQGKYIPGTSIPILPESAIKELNPDVIWIFPWNFEKQIKEKLSYFDGEFFLTGGSHA